MYKPVVSYEIHVVRCVIDDVCPLWPRRQLHVRTEYNWTRVSEKESPLEDIWSPPGSLCVLLLFSYYMRVKPLVNNAEDWNESALNNTSLDLRSAAIAQKEEGSIVKNVKEELLGEREGCLFCMMR